MLYFSSTTQKRDKNMQDNIVNKLILLFIFDKMEIPLSEDSLLDICSSANEWISYMDCKIALNDLLDTGFCYNSTQLSSSRLFSITPDGRSCIANFYTRIPSHVRAEISEYIAKNRLYYRKRQEYFTDYYRNNDGTYTVILKIFNTDRPQLDVKLIVESRSSAKNICKNWTDKAAQAYSALLEILTE